MPTSNDKDIEQQGCRLEYAVPVTQLNEDVHLYIWPLPPNNIMVSEDRFGGTLYVLAETSCRRYKISDEKCSYPHIDSLHKAVTIDQKSTLPITASGRTVLM